MYRGRAAWEVEELAQSMANGQDEPVEVTPGYEIISGHGRVEAAKRLGWKTIQCWVRHDLAAAGPEAVEARLIEANLYRRQLIRLDMARSYRHLMRFARDNRGRVLGESRAEQSVRKLIAERFRVSEKTLSRWLHVLDLPLVLQQAVDEDRLPLTVAVRVAGLAPAVQKKIAERVGQGEAPHDVIMPYLPKSKNDTKTVGKSLARLVGSLERARDELADRVAEVKGGLFGNSLDTLRHGRSLLDLLINKLESNREQLVSEITRTTALIGGSGLPASDGQGRSRRRRHEEEE